MGSIGGMLGLSGGAAGTGFSGPSAAPIVQGTTADQLQTAYGGAQNSLQSQQALLGALQAQNGLGNQNQVYSQLQGVANGTGPNPAQAQLAQATGQNIQNQAALMAGQRGASANTGLIARQAAQQGAAAQQNAIGQAATLQANQSLNALGAAGNLATTQAGQQIGATTANTQAQQSEQQILQNANSAFNTANVQQQAGINSANAGLAGQTMGAQQGLIGGILGGAGAAAGSAGGANGGMVHKLSAGGWSQEGDSEPVASAPVDMSRQPFQYAANDQAPQAINSQYQQPAAVSPSSFSKILNGWAASQGAQSSQGQSQQAVPTSGPGALQVGMTQFGKGIGNAMRSSGGGEQESDEGMAAGGPIKKYGFGGPSMQTQNDVVANATTPGTPATTQMSALNSASTPYEVAKIGLKVAPYLAGGAHGGSVGSNLKAGGHVPGKAKVKGNSYSNDTVKALLSPGEVVIPRNVMQSKNPVDGAARFVAAVLAKKGQKK